MSFQGKTQSYLTVRQVVLEWRQKHCIGCGTTLFVCIFDLLAIASSKRFNIPDVQTVLLSWLLDKNELKSTMHFSKLYGMPFLSVWRVRHTFFPSGWCFPTF